MRAKQKVFKKINKKHNQKRMIVITACVLGVILVMVGIFSIPAVQEKIAWRMTNVRASILYFLKPPEKMAFNPTQQKKLDEMVDATLTANAPTQTATPTITSTVLLTPTPSQTPLPTITPTPIPTAKQLSGVVHEFQKYNNCGPTNLAMTLTYWGWKGNQYTIADVVKPHRDDRNVMPYELLDYVQTNTEYSAVLRYGGDIDLIKRFIAGGFPVLIERGFDVAGKGWMGHYGVITGYNDASQEFHLSDSYEGPREIDYADLFFYWGHFDYLFIIVYPPDLESTVMSILGQHADESYNKITAAADASDRIYNSTGRELFFAWYSRGSILAAMDDYIGAAQAFDEAFRIYSELPVDKMTRPWRITWYQTGPYFAYYYTGRYYDIITLADQTISGQELFGFDFQPAFEETWIWRGRAKLMLGDSTGAIKDFKEALSWHPGWWVAENELRALGIEP